MLNFIVLWLEGVSSSSNKCTSRHGTRTSAFLRITSRENSKKPDDGCHLDHCYTFQKSTNTTPIVPPHSAAAADKTTLFIGERPCLSLQLDDVGLTKQDGGYDVCSLTCGDLAGPLSSCSPMGIASSVRTEDTVTNCDSTEDNEPFLSLLAHTGGQDDDTDADGIGESASKSDVRSAVSKPPQSAAARERVIHICDHCGKSFVRGKEYTEHRRTHTGDRPFHCDVCGRGFSRFRSVTEHRRQHTNERPFVCDVCSKQFYTSGELLKHRRYHSGEKRYHCTVCGKRFLRCGEFTDHRRVHTGQNVCLICGKAFTRLHNMKEHMSSAHAGTKRYICTTCGKQFAYSSGLRYHRRLHQSERPFKCPECEKCFARMGELNRHRRGAHKIVNLSTLLQN